MISASLVHAREILDNRINEKREAKHLAELSRIRERSLTGKSDIICFPIKHATSNGASNQNVSEIAISEQKTLNKQPRDCTGLVLRKTGLLAKPNPPSKNLSYFQLENVIERRSQSPQESLDKFNFIPCAITNNSSLHEELRKKISNIDTSKQNIKPQNDKNLCDENLDKIVLTKKQNIIVKNLSLSASQTAETCIPQPKNLFEGTNFLLSQINPSTTKEANSSTVKIGNACSTDKRHSESDVLQNRPVSSTGSSYANDNSPATCSLNQKSAINKGTAINSSLHDASKLKISQTPNSSKQNLPTSGISRNIGAIIEEKELKEHLLTFKLKKSNENISALSHDVVKKCPTRSRILPQKLLVSDSLSNQQQDYEAMKPGKLRPEAFAFLDKTSQSSPVPKTQSNNLVETAFSLAMKLSPQSIKTDSASKLEETPQFEFVQQVVSKNLAETRCNITSRRSSKITENVTQQQKSSILTAVSDFPETDFSLAQKMSSQTTTEVPALHLEEAKQTSFIQQTTLPTLSETVSPVGMQFNPRTITKDLTFENQQNKLFLMCPKVLPTSPPLPSRPPPKHKTFSGKPKFPEKDSKLTIVNAASPELSSPNNRDDFIDITSNNYTREVVKLNNHHISDINTMSINDDSLPRASEHQNQLVSASSSAEKTQRAVSNYSCHKPNNYLFTAKEDTEFCGDMGKRSPAPLEICDDFPNYDSTLLRSGLDRPSLPQKKLPQRSMSCSNLVQTFKDISPTNRIISFTRNVKDIVKKKTKSHSVTETPTLTIFTNSEEIVNESCNVCPTIPAFLLRKAWFHPVNALEAKHRLLGMKQDGAFLIRPSTARSHGVPYTLCIICGGSVRHCHIRLRNDGCYALGEAKDRERAFSTLSEMITYYQDVPLEIRTQEGSQICSVYLLVTPPNYASHKKI